MNKQVLTEIPRALASMLFSIRGAFRARSYATDASIPYQLEKVGMPKGKKYCRSPGNHEHEEVKRPLPGRTHPVSTRLPQNGSGLVYVRLYGARKRQRVDGHHAGRIPILVRQQNTCFFVRSDMLLIATTSHGPSSLVSVRCCSARSRKLMSV